MEALTGIDIVGTVKNLRGVVSTDGGEHGAPDEVSPSPEARDEGEHGPTDAGEASPEGDPLASL